MDGKQRVLQSAASPASVLSHKVQALRITTAPQPRNPQPSRMGDGPVTPPSPPSPPVPPQSADARIKSALSKLKIPISKLDPRDTETIKEAERAVAFLAGVGPSSARDLKHFYNYFSNFFLLGGVSVAGGPNPMDAGKQCASSLATFVSGQSPGFSLNEQIIAGNTLTQRIGRDILLQHLTIRMNCNWNQSIAPASHALYDEYMIPFRMIIFEDRQSISANPENCLSKDEGLGDGGSLFLNMAAGASQWLGNVAPYNPNTLGTRFRIYHDEIYNPPANATGLTLSTGNWCASAQSLHHFHVPLKGMHCRYVDDNVVGTSTLIKGNLYVMWAIDTTVAGIQPAIDFSSDLSFIDG